MDHIHTHTHLIAHTHPGLCIAIFLVLWLTVIPSMTWLIVRNGPEKQDA
jgi:hypothetical protein